MYDICSSNAFTFNNNNNIITLILTVCVKTSQTYIHTSRISITSCVISGSPRAHSIPLIIIIMGFILLNNPSRRAGRRMKDGLPALWELGD